MQKLIFLGLDGLDPGLAERYMAEGKLPNLSRLREQGGFHRLRTTFPALSPVAWSTFATGVNPARHNMFDFLNRNLRSYMPELSSTRVRDPERVLSIGKYRIPLSRPIVEMRRKSRTFWQILGEHQIASHHSARADHVSAGEVQRPHALGDVYAGSAGHAGHFRALHARAPPGDMESGNRYPLDAQGRLHHGEIEGPENHMEDGAGAMKIPFTLRETRAGVRHSRMPARRDRTAQGEYTPWVTLTFKAAPRHHGQRHRALPADGDRARAFAVSDADQYRSRRTRRCRSRHPGYYATYLAKLLGTYSHAGHGRGHVGAERTRHR